MDFGKISLAQVEKTDFTLPSTPKGTVDLLQKSSKKTDLQVFTGCPIWANKTWVGSIYPLQAKEKDFLKYYTQQFNTIELNVTHYNIPTPSVIERWRSQAQQGFRFAPKFPQEISHQLLPEGKAKDLTWVFCQVVSELQDHLGTSFLQLPPYFAPTQADKLIQFLEDLPKEFRLAVELRHPDWFKGGNFEKIAEILENHQIGTVMTDVAGRRDVLHLRLTTPILMLRFVGNDLHPTDYQRVKAWVQRIAEWRDLGLQTVYFFAHEPDNNSAPDLARFFMEEMNRVCDLGLPTPHSYKVAEQGKLF